MIESNFEPIVIDIIIDIIDSMSKIDAIGDGIKLLILI